MRLVDESVAPKGVDNAHSRRWAIWHHQFDLVRSSDNVRYLRRWWLVKTPWGGVILHRMDAPDARTTLHDHPFTFLSVVLRGGYIERRLEPRTMMVTDGHRVRRWNLMRAGVDAHAIHRLLRVPTWTLLFVGRHRRKWGFLEPETVLPNHVNDGQGGTMLDGRWGATAWRWVDAHRYDSGHYVPLSDGTS